MGKQVNSQRYMAAVAAAVTLMFTSCGTKPEEKPVLDFNKSDTTTGDPTVSSITPANTSDVEPFNLGKYWINGTDVAEANKKEYEEVLAEGTLVEEKAYLGLFNIYADEDGKEFIISGNEMVYLLDGRKLAPEQMETLRREGTFEKVYVTNNQLDLKLLLCDGKPLDKYLEGVERPVTIAQRDERFEANMDSVDTETFKLFVNGFPVDFGCHNKYISISDISAELIKQYYSYTVNNSVYEIKVTPAHGAIEISGKLASGVAAVGVVVDGYHDFIQGYATTDGMNLKVGFEPLRKHFGWDIEIYAEQGVVNLVTDSADVVKMENVVVVEEQVCNIPGGALLQPEKVNNPFRTEEDWRNPHGIDNIDAYAVSIGKKDRDDLTKGERQAFFQQMPHAYTDIEKQIRAMNKANEEYEKSEQAQIDEKRMQEFKSALDPEVWESIQWEFDQVLDDVG